MKFKVNVAGEEREVEVISQGERLRIAYGDQVAEVHVLHTDGPHFVLEYDHPAGEFVQRRRLRAAGHLDGDRRQLWVNGSNLTYERVREHGPAGAAAAGSLSASIPAVVSEVLVAEGDRVTAGDKLILLESMKMILPIQAPYDGTIGAIHCTAGESVQPGVPLVEVEED